ncbi:MAG: hypothetical protein IPL61_11855 [Myxococcales bacterium]|nr:hypothetical protein [Myxococcales bacterium]
MSRLVALALVFAPTAALADAPAALDATDVSAAAPMPDARDEAPTRVAAADAIEVTAVPAYAVGPSATAPVAEPAITDTSAEPVGLDRRRRDDAAAGRSYFAETALTTPRGHVTFDVRAPLLPVAAVGLRLGVTDRVEVGVNMITVVDEGAVAGLSVKGQLWRSARFAVAAGLTTYSADGDTLYNPHVEGTACVDAACVGAVTLSLNFLGFSGEDTVPVLAGVGVAYGRGVQLVGELHQTRDGDEALTGGFLGMRAASGRFALDGGLGFGFATNTCDDVDCGDGGAFPFVGMAARL